MLTVDLGRLEMQPGDCVLDLGCGNGRHSYEVQMRGGIAVAADLDPTALGETRAMMLALAAERSLDPGTVCRTDALRLPFGDATFDRVIAAEVLEHIPADSDAMAEIARVLKPGGTAAVSVPRYWPERICWALSEGYHSNEGGHVRIYRRSELADRLVGAGLRIYGSHHAHALHSPYWWLRCAFGMENGSAAIPRAYHRFLVWDIEHPHLLVRGMERLLDPVMGKSVVLYLRRSPVTVDA